MLPDDCRIADLPVAESQLVVGKADGSGIVRALRQPQGLGEKCHPAGGLSAGGGHAAVHAPEVGQLGRIGPLPRFGRSPKCLSRLTEVVLEQPGFSQRCPKPDLVFAGQPRLTEGAGQERRSLGAVPVRQGLDRSVG